MRNKKIFVTISIVISIVCCLIFLYLFFVKTDTIKLTWMPTPDGQEQINEYIEAGYCTSGYVAKDNSYAEIRLTEWQRRKWLKFEKDDLQFMLQKINCNNDIKVTISTEFDEMVICADKEASFETLATYLTILAYGMEVIDLLNGDEQWGFDFVVKDLESKKEIYYVSFPEESISINADMWDEIEE